MLKPQNIPIKIEKIQKELDSNAKINETQTLMIQQTNKSLPWKFNADQGLIDKNHNNTDFHFCI